MFHRVCCVFQLAMADRPTAIEKHMPNACVFVCTCISCQYGCRCVKRGTAGVNMHVCTVLLNYYYNCQQTTTTTTKLSYRDYLLCCLSQGGAGGRDKDMKMIHFFNL